MKIAINLTRENVGGITSSNLNLINYLYKLDHEFIGLELTSRMYMKGPTLFRSFSPEIFDHHILNIHHLPLMGSVKRSGTLKGLERIYERPIRIIRGILKETHPDVVLLSGTYYMPWLISIAAKAEKIPVVLWYSGVLSKETEHYPEKMRRIFSSMEKAVVRNSTKIIFPSELCKKTVEQLVLKDTIKNSFVIPNPIATLFTNPSVVDASIERRIAAVGRYSTIKNFDKFFDLHRELRRRKWRHTASFVTNPDADLKKMPKTVELLPSMTAEGLKQFYLAQGLIVCPSTFETFGNVPMEAACLGIPVLVSDTMGCAEILRKVGLENMVISFGDIKEVADRAQELCGQSILPRQLNALKRILDNNFVSEEIRAVLDDSIKKRMVSSANHYE
ncbi:MAG: glycosyltransferase family 4 protein [Candidatus Niyogibacteria bacterium]|nr:glycosyltransferase family 4 protein [Candidatus Niyogibacteria bacterium]